jgi:hypothetical protein
VKRSTMLLSLLGIMAWSCAISDTRSRELLDKYFDALGGRDEWALGHGEYVLAKVEDPRFPLPGTFEFCWSWDEPKTADRSRFQGLTQLRSYTGDAGWTFVKPSGDADGTVKIWNDARKIRGQAEWNGNFEVLTHRLAARDERVTTRMGEGPWASWIEISVDAQVVALLQIAESGVPKKFHRVFDDITVVFGPLAERGRINFPAWGAFEGGEPFDLIAFEILGSAPREPFEKPDPGDSGLMNCS